VRYQFLVDTYATEIIKVLSVWSFFEDADLRVRPHPRDLRGRNLLEHMVHQSVSEDFWFRTMLGIRVTVNPLPEKETRLEFMQAYARNSSLRLEALAPMSEEWWESETKFFDELRTRLWVMTRRLTHTAHHRGQQTAMLRMLGRDLHSTYGPTADTGGLMMAHAPTIYAYANESTLLEEEGHARRKTPLPATVPSPVTERPDTTRA
jgi:uncharacterized damage-inducible protein DinB